MSRLSSAVMLRLSWRWKKDSASRGIGRDRPPWSACARTVHALGRIVGGRVAGAVGVPRARARGGRARRRAARPRPAPHGLRPRGHHDAVRRGSATRSLAPFARWDTSGSWRSRRTATATARARRSSRCTRCSLAVGGHRDRGRRSSAGALALDGARRRSRSRCCTGSSRSTTAAAVARGAVLATAFLPMSFFLSAVYSESLFLALSVGAVYAARTDRWAWAGVARRPGGGDAQRGRRAARAARAHLVGRASAPPARARPALAGARAGRRRRVLPVPVGVRRRPAGAVRGAGGLVPRRSRARSLGAWDGARRRLAGRAPAPVRRRASRCTSRPPGGDPFVVARHNIELFAWLVAALAALALGAAAAARSRTSPTSSRRSRCRSPTRSAPQPLMSLPRFLLVLFPLAIAVAAWATERRRRGPVAARTLGAIGLAVYTGDLRDVALGGVTARHPRRARARSSSSRTRTRRLAASWRPRRAGARRGARAALRAEMAYYREHHDIASDADGLARLRDALHRGPARRAAGAGLAALGARRAARRRCSPRCASARSRRSPDVLRDAARRRRAARRREQLGRLAARGAGARPGLRALVDAVLTLGGGRRGQARRARCSAPRSSSPARAPARGAARGRLDRARRRGRAARAGMRAVLVDRDGAAGAVPAGVPVVAICAACGPRPRTLPPEA